MEQMPVGEVVIVDGIKKRHLGGGVFEPVGEEMFKRFGSDDCGPIGGKMDDE